MFEVNIYDDLIATTEELIESTEELPKVVILTSVWASMYKG